MTPYAMEKMAVVVPLPSASIRMAVALKPGLRRNVRSECRSSWSISEGESEAIARPTAGALECVPRRRVGVRVWDLESRQRTAVIGLREPGQGIRDLEPGRPGADEDMGRGSHSGIAIERPQREPDFTGVPGQECGQG